MQQAPGEESAPIAWSYYFNLLCLAVYITVLVISGVGYWYIRWYYNKPLKRSISAHLPLDQVPHVTILRPITGIEPNLRECLASTFRQDYPGSKHTIYLCVPSRRDSAYTLAKSVLEDFPDRDARLFIEEEDTGRPEGFGPNPKIGNLSRAYREAKGDILWVIDCNVWVNKGTMGRMVDRLNGYGTGPKRRMFKFVHQLPIVVAMTDDGNLSTDGLRGIQSQETFGSRLDEIFLSAAHAKFYTAINVASIAPCIVGKSNMFRKSHLDAVTLADSTPERPFTGLDYFSVTICEDHLLADMLWYRTLPEFLAREDASWGHHGMLHGDPAIQPLAQMSVRAYASRRARWLRVRKFVVPAATLVEPLTESFVCSLVGAKAATSLPFFTETLAIPRTWTAFFLIWLVGVSAWMLVDWTQYITLQAMRTVEVDQYTPSFARPPMQKARRRPFFSWLTAWIAREAMAFPVWSYAVLGGTRVVWRGKEFWVGLDMKVHHIKSPSSAKKE